MFSSSSSALVPGLLAAASETVFLLPRAKAVVNSLLNNGQLDASSMPSLMRVADPSPALLDTPRRHQHSGKKLDTGGPLAVEFEKKEKKEKKW